MLWKHAWILDRRPDVWHPFPSLTDCGPCQSSEEFGRMKNRLSLTTKASTDVNEVRSCMGGGAGSWGVRFEGGTSCVRKMIYIILMDKRLVHVTLGGEIRTIHISHS